MHSAVIAKQHTGGPSVIEQPVMVGSSAQISSTVVCAAHAMQSAVIAWQHIGPAGGQPVMVGSPAQMSPTVVCAAHAMQSAVNASQHTGWLKSSSDNCKLVTRAIHGCCHGAFCTSYYSASFRSAWEL